MEDTPSPTVTRQRMARTTITLRPDQKRWIDDNDFPLSNFVRKKLDNHILKQGMLGGPDPDELIF